MLVDKLKGILEGLRDKATIGGIKHMRDLAQEGLDTIKEVKAMTVDSPVPENHPLMIAWNKHKQSEYFANSKKWAAYPEHAEGSLWALFSAGYHAATKQEISKPSDSRWEQAGEIFRELNSNASVDIYALHEKYLHSPGMLAWFITTFSQMVDEKEGILSLKPKTSCVNVGITKDE